jgi:hypothetical protein
MYVTENNKKNFQSILLLDQLVAGSRQFKIVAEPDDKVLEPFFLELMAKGYVDTSGQYYVATAKGKETYELFNKRFQEYLRLFDIFSFVDLTKGEFAFARFFDFDTDEDWDNFTNDERFEDLRIAVAILKKMDPAEIVFMSFINEKRIDTQITGWQMDLVTDDLWHEIEEICATSLKPEQLGTPDVIEDIVRQGTELMITLLKDEQTRQKEDAEVATAANGAQQQPIVEEYETVEYYQPYYDPWYVSPFWLMPLFLW